MNSNKGGLEREIRETIRQKSYSYKTEETYVHWYKRFVKFSQMRHPESMGEEEISRFLTHLAANRGVAAATQNQALNALVFLYRHVIGRELVGIDAKRPKLGKRLPSVLTQDEVGELFSCMNGIPLLQARILYGCGLRLNECLTLRVKDVDLRGHMLWVRAGKGL